MVKKLEKEDPTWMPATPVKIDSDSGMTDKGRNVTGSRKRKRIKKHIPKVCKPVTPKPKTPRPPRRMETKVVTPKPKTPRPPRRMETKVYSLSGSLSTSTPKSKTPMLPRCAKNKVDSLTYVDNGGDCSRKIPCAKRLDFDNVCLQGYGTINKRKRMRRRSISLENLVRLFRVIHPKPCFYMITWSKRRRSRMFTRCRKDFSSLIPFCIKTQDDGQRVVDDLINTQHVSGQRVVDDLINTQHVVAVSGGCGMIAASGECRNYICAPKPVESIMEIKDEVRQVDVKKELVDQCNISQDDVGCIGNSASESGDFTCVVELEQKNVYSIQDTDVISDDTDTDVCNGNCGDDTCAVESMESITEQNNVSSVQVYITEQKNVSSIQDDAFEKALVDFATEKIHSLNIVDGSNQLMIWDIKDKKKHNYQLVLDKKERKQRMPKVDLDEKTKRVWHSLMEYINKEDEDTEAKEDDNMEDERAIFRGRVDSFIRLMYHLSGDRQFSRWKGSVVDSVVGVILTQNVSDSLSSNAFMTLAARYPATSKSEENGSNECMGSRTQPEEIDESLVEKGEESNPSEQNDNECMVSRSQQVEREESLFGKDEESNRVNEDENENKTLSTNHEATVGGKKGKAKNKQENLINWDDLRRKYNGGSGKRNEHNADIVDWEAVRHASVGELARLIEERGQSNQLTPRIKDFLDRLVKDHGSIDLEWLRDVPPDKAKDYLMSIKGIGLKSTECVRLLSLYQPSFPIDVNAGRVLVRLGWVPLQPLPDDIPIHLLKDYPVLADVQKYIWPRICDRDALTLYELHCYLNIFSKAFCTKTLPNCNACPMRGECKHYASKLASSTLQLEGSKMASESRATCSRQVLANGSPSMLTNSPNNISSQDEYTCSGSQPTVEFLASPELEPIEPLGGYTCSGSQPIVEFPASPEPEPLEGYTYCGSQPMVEFPASPEPEPTEPLGGDIEDFTYESQCSTITLSIKENSPSYVECDDALCKAVVALSPRVAPVPMPKVEYVDRLRTVHDVYELPDSHPLLAGFPKREPEDPCPYLLATWTTNERTDSCQEFKALANSEESAPELCSSQESTTGGADTCTLREIVQCQKDQKVLGTILIPCRTANRGAFPLNGTYFQINEVFADHESSVRPIEVPREWIRNLRNRTLYCGKGASSICRGMNIIEIVYCFTKGFVCIRGFEKETGRPRTLSSIFLDSGSRKSVKK